MFGTRVTNYHEKNFEQRAAIKFCSGVGFTAAKTWEMFVKVFGDSPLWRVMVFPRASWRMIAENTRIPKTIVHRISSDDLKKRKLCAWFVPHALTTEQWEQCMIHAKDLTIPYSPDLSPLDYFPFPKLKMELKGDQYATISDIQTSVTTKLKTIPITDFSRAMHRLENCANQYIAVNSNYFK